MDMNAVICVLHLHVRKGHFMVFNKTQGSVGKEADDAVCSRLLHHGFSFERKVQVCLVSQCLYPLFLLVLSCFLSDLRLVPRS